MADPGSTELLRRLSLSAGPPGAEDEVRRLVRRELNGLGTIAFDRLGSLLCEKRGRSDAPRVVLDSHLDEVGFMVQSVGIEGRLSFVPLGGWWGHVLLSQRVEVLTDRGKVPGIVGSKPPHFLDPAERERVVKLESMYIDVGASTRADVEALGVKIGDPVVPTSAFEEMAVEGVVSGKAFDDRAGVAVMCETLAALADRDHPNTVIGVAAVQEELGGRGAVTASELARPDVAVVLECTPADDSPGAAERQGVLGGGPQIRHYDPTALSNRHLVRLVETVADDCGLQIQLAVRRTGGTDAGQIHRWGTGVPTVVIGVPARYIHSHVGLLNMKDFAAARELTLALVMRLDAACVEELTRFD